MKHILLTIITIFGINTTLLYSQNNCNILPIQESYKTWKDNGNEDDISALKNFINSKQQLKQAQNLLLSHKSVDDSTNVFDKFITLRRELRNTNCLIVGDSSSNYPDKKSYYTRCTILIDNYNQIFDIIKVNISDSIITSKHKLFKLQVFSRESNGDTIFYRINKQYYDTFFSIIETITIDDFNACDLLIQKNIEALSNDIKTAEKRFENLTTKEYFEWDFKKSITLFVAILLAIILICFFIGVLHKAGDGVKQKLIGETGLQFITIFVIIIAVILFGVMNILKGSELAAILSAIAGYILGKTSPNKSEKALEIELEILKLQAKNQENNKVDKDTDKKIVKDN